MKSPAARVPCQVTAFITARQASGTMLIRGVRVERAFELGSQALDMLMQGDFQFGGQHGDLFIAGAGEQAIA
jgi:hypothetical protein